jgi:hypothetical protein
LWTLYTNQYPSTFNLVVRVLEPQGNITVEARTVVSSSPGAQQLSANVTGVEGYILSACVAGPNVNPGTSYTTLTLMRPPYAASGLVSAQLLAEYVSDKYSPSYPSTAPRPAFQVPGSLVSLTASPAAGVDWSFTAAPNARWRVVGGYCGLITSATVATRNVTLVVKDSGGNNVAVFPASGSQAASLTQYYSVAPGGAATSAGAFFTIPTPTEVFVVGGGSVGTYTGNLQPGDQYQYVNLQVMVWVGV